MSALEATIFVPVLVPGGLHGYLELCLIIQMKIDSKSNYCDTAIFFLLGIHISLVICVWGNTCHRDTHITVTALRLRSLVPARLGGKSAGKKDSPNSSDQFIC